jgi:hypothetical protein
MLEFVSSAKGAVFKSSLGQTPQDSWKNERKR